MIPSTRFQSPPQPRCSWADTMPRENASYMMTEVFQEHSLRLYTRSRDPAVKHAIEEAFERWLGRYVAKNALNTRSTLTSTPMKKKLEKEERAQQARRLNGGSPRVGQGAEVGAGRPPKRPRALDDALERASQPDT